MTVVSWWIHKERFSDHFDNVKSLAPEVYDDVLVLQLQSPENVTQFSVPYENNRAHDMHVLCSQVEDYPQFKIWTTMKFEDADQHLREVSKERIIYSTKMLKEDNILDIVVLTELN